MEIAADAPQGLCPKCVLEAAAKATEAIPQSRGRTTAPTVDEVAAQFPEFEVLELIGAGGMGAVYKARQPKLDRFVALKILSADLMDDPAFAQRFNREGQILARLSHPHIVSVFDFGNRGPFLYLLMEYVDGVNLREAMQAAKFAPGDCLALVQDLCAALKFAHDEGILHRDIKPENVLLDSRGRVKIADFGIAKLIGRNASDSATLTQQGAVMGTLHYMAPEQLETPLDVDQRADIYSLGVVFYELLTGELPIGRFALPSDNSSLDPRVDEVVLRALERKREQRYQTVGEVKTEVDAITQSSNGESKGRGSDGDSTARKPPKSTPKTSRAVKLTAISAAASLLLGIATVSSAFVVDTYFPRHDFLLALVPGVGLLMTGVSVLFLIFFGIKSLGGVQKLATLAAKNVAKIPGEAPQTARFANASAMLTTFSLFLNAAVMIVLIAANSLVSSHEDFRDLLMWTIGGIGLLCVLASGILGFFFGLVAMGTIHQSAGRKSGFGAALLGVLGWIAIIPITAVGMLIFFLVA